MKLFIRTFAVLLAVCLAAPAMAAQDRAHPTPATLPSGRNPDGTTRMPACFFAHMLLSHGSSQAKLASLSNDCLARSLAAKGYALHTGNYAKTFHYCSAGLLDVLGIPSYSSSAKAWARTKCGGILTHDIKDGRMVFTHYR